ncbi:hypothetical protein MRBLMI12_003582 [Microbacterium sp. LMI12-1-1.1]|uniref:hypothetical protein n=1 Tax=Microbacterium sp. LMI12-1-1.1 TaxID=3135225 RepID=UPI003417E633
MDADQLELSRLVPGGHDHRRPRRGQLGHDADSTKAVYWVGTYTAPTEDTDTYSWESQADAAALGNALLASQDPTKTVSYSNGMLSYELTAMGVTVTVEMQRQ